MNWVMKNKRLFRWLEWIAIVVIVALAVSSFVAATDPHVTKNVLLSGGVHRFWLGIMMSAVNPVQIPFWFRMEYRFLFTKNILQHRNDHYNFYIAGIGSGTFTGNLIFIFRWQVYCGKIRYQPAIITLDNRRGIRCYGFNYVLENYEEAIH